MDDDSVFGDVISIYSRADALADEELFDVSADAREAGFGVPVAVTRAVWYRVIEPTEAEAALGQDRKGRAWDVLWLMKVASRRAAAATDRITFEVMVLRESMRLEKVALKALCHPGDAGEPVITIMLPEED